MQKNTFFGIVIGLIIGLIAGFFTANTINRSAAVQPQNIPAASAPVLNSQPSAAVQTTQDGMLSEVNETLEKAKNEPENFEAQAKAGDMYSQIQKFEKAVELYEKAHRINREDYQTIVKIGNAYFDLRQYETAQKWYLQALEKNPEDTNVRTDLGVTFVERANPDLDRAISEFQTSLEKNPRHEPTIYNLGVAFYRKGDAQEAQKTLQQLEAINPQSALAGRLRQMIAK